jgi:hypothetical protein
MEFGMILTAIQRKYTSVKRISENLEFCRFSLAVELQPYGSKNLDG